MTARMAVSQELKSEIEDFLYTEAELLDSWRIEDWFELFTDDCFYWVPGASDDLKTHPSIIYDDHGRLEDRVQRLLNPAVHTQVPRSRTRRLVSNVRIHQQESSVKVLSNFLLYEVRLDRERLLGGEYQHVLRRDGGRWRIQEKKVTLMNADTALRFVTILF